MSTVVQIVGDNTTVFETTDDQAIVSSQVTGLQGPQGTTGATGATGAQGPSGVISVTSPITNSGSSTSAQLGFDQTAQNTTNDGRYARLASANAFTVGGHTITAESAAIIPLRINAAASQSGNLLECRNSAGTVLASITSVGTLLIPAASLRIGTSIANTSFAVNNDTAATTTVVAVVRGIASQSANLQEWQNSGGTVLARIESTGAVMFGAGNMSVTNTGSLFAAALSTNVGRIVMAEENSGGRLTITRQTAATTNPGANIARFYVRDGTNAGTLKFVVRAGASGAETTILDNIPQT